MAEGRKSRKRTVLVVVGCVALLLIAAVAGVMIWITSGLGSYARMSIKNVDFSKVPDGSYMGSFSGGRFSNTVEVTVKDHKVTDIRVVHDMTFSKASTTRAILGEVEKAQSLQVDTVTGATATSKAYLKAIENALAGSH